MYDEAEKQVGHAHHDTVMQNVLALARSASTGTSSSIVKGSRSGAAVSFQMWSMFLLSSVSPGLREEAEKTRVSVLQLHGKASIAARTRADHWKLYQPRMSAVDDEQGRSLMARTIAWLRDGRLAQTVRVCRSAAAGILGDTRSGDQLGTLYAGAWTLMSDQPPSGLEARELIGSSEVNSFVNDAMPVGQKVLETLLQAGARIDFDSGPSRSYAVGELVEAVRPGATNKIEKEARDWLNRHGMKVIVMSGESVLLLANNSQWIRDTLRDTPYADGWRDSLRSVQGVVIGGSQVVFMPGLSSRVVIVPLTLLTHWDGDD